MLHNDNKYKIKYKKTICLLKMAKINKQNLKNAYNIV